MSDMTERLYYNDSYQTVEEAIANGREGLLECVENACEVVQRPRSLRRLYRRDAETPSKNRNQNQSRAPREPSYLGTELRHLLPAAEFRACFLGYLGAPSRAEETAAANCTERQSRYWFYSASRR